MWRRPSLEQQMRRRISRPGEVDWRSVFLCVLICTALGYVWIMDYEPGWVLGLWERLVGLLRSIAGTG